MKAARRSHKDKCKDDYPVGNNVVFADKGPDLYSIHARGLVAAVPDYGQRQLNKKYAFEASRMTVSGKLSPHSSEVSPILQLCRSISRVLYSQGEALWNCVS